MNKYTQDQHIRTVETFYSSNESIGTVQRNFMQPFKLRSSPSRKCIIDIVKQFREFGTVSDKKTIWKVKNSTLWS